MNQQTMQCKYFENCNAPICPFIKDQDIFFPDESICQLRRYSTLPWVQLQVKIAKKTRDQDSYYTMDMLNRSCIIRSGIKGIDPNKKNESEQILKWLNSHKPYIHKGLADPSKFNSEVEKQSQDGVERGIQLDPDP